MDSNPSPGDLESGQKEQSLPSRKSNINYLFLQEAAALLTIWSILVINEGAIRLMSSNPSAGLTGGRPSVSLMFLGGLFEVFFGLLGLFLGLAAFILRLHNALLTKLSMVVQTILGYFVFIVFVFLVPAFVAADMTEPSLIGLSLGQSKFLVVLGILTSFHFCLALQGGQFLFMARLVCAATGEDFLKQQTGAKMRAIFWNGNMGLAGVWTLITGILVAANVDSGILDMKFFDSPPNVGRVPGITMFTGAVMIIWAVVGMLMGMRAGKGAVPVAYYGGSGVVYLIAFLNYGIVQFGLIEGFAAAPVVLHAGLVFMTVFLGPYFVHVVSKEKEEEVY